MDPITKPKEKRTYRDRREYFKAYHKKKYAEDEEFRNNVIKRAKKSYLKKCINKATDPCGCVCGGCFNPVSGDRVSLSSLKNILIPSNTPKACLPPLKMFDV